MHPPEVREAVLELIDAGHNDCEVARRTGLPRTTIRDWRRPTYVSTELQELCPRCWRRAKSMRFSPSDYSELLGLYLGDGCISAYGRTFRLRVTLDERYPEVIEQTRALLARSLPQNRVAVVSRSERCVDVSTYSVHLPCLLPQHGPGGKHRRPIVLEPWQTTIVDDQPWPFIRGCIRTDGCSFVNRTGKYEYLSYDFTNKSTDITQLFLGACSQVGVTTRSNWSDGGQVWRVRINQRESVALMEQHVGLKT
jgi:hypothetical protein